MAGLLCLRGPSIRTSPVRVLRRVGAITEAPIWDLWHWRLFYDSATRRLGSFRVIAPIHSYIYGPLLTLLSLFSTVLFRLGTRVRNMDD